MPHSLAIKDALNQAYRKQKVRKSDLEHFTTQLSQLLERVKHSEERKESEENFKNLLSDFLKDTYYKDRHEINTYGRTDLVIHTDKSAKSSVGVLLEVKRPTNKADMVTQDNLDAKAMHELLLYYFRQKDQQNNDIKYCIITNIYEWYIFDAAEFFREFEKDKALKKEYHAWKNRQKESSNTDYFYQHIASPAVAARQANLSYTYLNLHDYEKLLAKADQAESRKLVMLYKLFSPEHLLKQSFVNDSNSLDRKFYNELLHIIGLSEVKEKGKKLIERKAEGERDSGSILENTISVLKAENRVYRLREAEKYGKEEEERHFNVALELTITWLNRILFLKLLEAQLINYHDSKAYAFLYSSKIRDFDELNSLFFEVLAQKTEHRDENVKKYFGSIPYLNSSLFEPTELEHETIFISNLKNRFELPVYRQTVLKDEQGKTLKDTRFSTLEYLFRFLDAYDFSSEGGEEVQEENKTLINASVLGLIFEKINGYKDGSFFTPGFITMYMSRETIRKAVVQKFNQAFQIDCTSFEELQNYASSRNYKTDFIRQGNELINSLTICDPAVGSGHFLVSALNEILAIKSELGILADKKYQGLPVRVAVVNDELMVTTPQGDFFEYRPGQAEAQRIQESLFHEKETLIESCLFGVDINENSVKICRLRLWIELLKNAYYTAESDYKELETLPNIDINIKAGNSLLYRFDLQEDLSDVFRKQKFSLQTYKDTVRAYKSTHSKEAKRELMAFLREIKEQFRTSLTNRDPLRKKMSKLRGEVEIMENPSDLFGDVKVDQKLLARKKKELAKLEQEKADIESNRLYEGAFEWRFEFPEVLDAKGDFVGFDVVIGNPPYIRQEEIKEMKPYLQQKFATFAGTADLLVYFIEHSMNILKTEGYFTYIIANKFMRANFGKSLRKWMQQFQFEEIIDFGDLPVFEEATTYPCILSLHKAKPVHPFTAATVEDLDFDSLPNYLQSVAFSSDQAKLSNEGWSLSDKRVQQLLEKLRMKGKPLGEYVDGKIFYGIKTGLNEAFVIDMATKDRLIAEDPKSAEVIKPFLAGRDIKKYKEPATKNYLIFARRGIEIEKYPKILKYLEQFRDRLEPKPKYWNDAKDGDWVGRKAGSYLWYEIQDAVDYYQEFEKPKIIVPAIVTSASYAYDTLGAYSNDKTSIIPTDDLFLLGMLNSQAVDFTIKFISSTKRGGYYEYKPMYVSLLPIVEADEEKKHPIRELVNQILKTKSQNPSADTSALEAEIDQLVYQLYGLTEEEIKIIEDSVSS
ncbi:MAG: class I SAM-dependent DNA methyltransferase [Cyclobacteriaceae bacterium]